LELEFGIAISNLEIGILNLGNWTLGFGIYSGGFAASLAVSLRLTVQHDQRKGYAC
jgi:hypothetical protein